MIVLAGRHPQTDSLGLEGVGATIDERGAVVVDETCNAVPGMRAIGDVNAIMPFTYVGMSQGRVVADAILARGEL